jgi:protocatechuate 3,4-dioxygenase beta subunit
MLPRRILTPRRTFLGQSLAGASLLISPQLLADELQRTAEVAEGPFYPNHMPLDTDNDLLIINHSDQVAIGEVTHLSGRVLTADGGPVRNAFVEIWQCDHSGAYLHPGSSNKDQQDKNFQGYGRFLTDAAGRYYFRTIKPVPYPGRTPHIHFGVSQHGRRVLTTQMLIRGEPRNEQDGLFRQLTDPKQRATILVDFLPIAESRIGELTANFDIVLGMTPDEAMVEAGLGKLPPANR